jgi:hypothetical protein
MLDSKIAHTLQTGSPYLTARDDADAILARNVAAADTAC